MLVENQLHEPAEKNGFMLKLTRALCNQTWPSPEDRQLAWQSVAFTNYVPVSVGYGARRRPAPAAWRQAADEWPDLLEKLSPRNIIILGLSLWDNMPSPKNAAGAVGKFPQRSPAVREYVTESGNVTRCWCHWHPSAGASADSLRDVIAEAENAA
ncbi:hypothetical protein AA23498_1228 [Acetobacter nitrogenifigens DSM 23921 = NBRC 105050]|uniref:Uracil-DNA glycosylase-like domain-containing protein n=2 Tax=Acetobacter nitrogenifigens TaxID=285268 RepID=A0A511XD63_9PROT|nr:hypothetical protein AA23498_1228 [Acetobacter nitrogenifigens DSM 23921 = NBRC 105050]GEN60821.1 hypothetical protein ANI02nite_27050 [Acetobacter nitrogenifigens DSM 23921 = NBRC 105050]